MNIQTVAFVIVQAAAPTKLDEFIVGALIGVCIAWVIVNVLDEW
jgi:hypothetical protein